MARRDSSPFAALPLKQRRAVLALEEAFIDPVRRAYAAGLDASRILLALWHASDRVEGLPPFSELPSSESAELTLKERSPIVKRGVRKTKGQ